MELRDEVELKAEYEAHLAHRVDDLVAGGLGAEEARERAVSEFGDRARLMEESRAARAEGRARSMRGRATDAVRQDLSFAFRQLKRSRGFSLTALITLTLGIGATAAIVSVVDAVVLTPLPFHEPDRVVFPERLTPEGARFSVSEPAFLDWQREVAAFSDVAAIETRGATLRSPGEPRSVPVAAASHGLLHVLGVEPALGRMFRAEEDLPASEASVALLSYETWWTEHAASPAVLGTRVDLDGTLYEIVGVMPPAVALLAPDVLLFVPLGADPGEDRGDSSLAVVARLSPGVTLSTARAELDQVQARLGAIHGSDLGWGATIQTGEFLLIGESTARAGWILLTAAGLLLLMACVNVSNLLMVRATARHGEMQLRAAIGASRGRLVRQLFTESALLVAVGGFAGVALARLALPVLRGMGGARIPRLESAQLDATALLACVLATGLAVLACGLAPVVQLRSGTIAGAARRTSDSGRRTRSALVGAQVAISVVLLAGTGLLLRSFVELTRIDPGFEAEGTLAVRISMPDRSYEWGERAQIFPVLRQAVASLPGVAEVGATAVDPFSGDALGNFVARVDRMPDRAADFTPIQWRVVTPGFFEAMGMELRAGRTFVETDAYEGGTPILIGQRLADALFDAGESPIDRVLVWGDPEGSHMRVVGVVEDLRDVRLDEELRPIVYRPYQQIPWAEMVLVARVVGDPAVVAAGIRSRIQEAVPGLPVPEIRSLEANLREAVAEPRFNLQLLSAFTVVGLLMAVVGVYGLTAFDVRRRFREIGIRISLGARPEEVRSMILRQRLRVTAVGAGVGLAAAWWLVRGIEGQLYGVTASDPATWLAVVVVIGATAPLATYLPARRATDVDPREVLGGE
jgi:predicted permease